MFGYFLSVKLYKCNFLTTHPAHNIMIGCTIASGVMLNPNFLNIACTYFSCQTFESEEGVDDPIAIFTAKVNNIAEKNIPKTSTVPRKIDKPWFNWDCRKAIDKRKKSLQKFKKHPTRQNLGGYKKDYAKARCTISEAKRQFWRAYVSTLNNNTSAKHTW